MPKQASQTKRISIVQSGVAGEYLVAGELSRRGYIASIILRNTRGVDILAANEAGTRSVEIQVKTNQDDSRKWVLSEKAKSLSDPGFFYVFVALRGLLQPRYHIVPSAVVVRFTRRFHREWLAGRRRARRGGVG